MATMAHHHDEVALLALRRLDDGLLDVVRDHELTVKRDTGFDRAPCKGLQYLAGMGLALLLVLLAGLHVVSHRHRLDHHRWQRRLDDEPGDRRAQHLGHADAGRDRFLRQLAAIDGHQQVFEHVESP
jgi:hypothetical protein